MCPHVLKKSHDFSLNALDIGAHLSGFLTRLHEIRMSLGGGVGILHCITFFQKSYPEEDIDVIVSGNESLNVSGLQKTLAIAARSRTNADKGAKQALKSICQSANAWITENSNITDATDSQTDVASKVS